MFEPLSRGVRTTILAAVVLLAVPQTSDAQYFFGRGAYFGGGFNTPYYGGGFFGPAYGGYGWGGYGGARSFAYASAYSNSSSYTSSPTIINNNIYVTPSMTNQQLVDPPAPTPGNKAAIDVIVPADAELWFDGTRTKLTGAVRSFVTPSLTEGTYSYEIRATWKDQSGSVVTRTRLVQVTPNQHLLVNLTDIAQEMKKSQ